MVKLNTVARPESSAHVTSCARQCEQNAVGGMRNVPHAEQRAQVRRCSAAASQNGSVHASGWRATRDWGGTSARVMFSSFGEHQPAHGDGRRTAGDEGAL